MMSVEFIHTARDLKEFFTALQNNIDMTENVFRKKSRSLYRLF